MVALNLGAGSVSVDAGAASWDAAVGQLPARAHVVLKSSGAGKEMGKMVEEDEEISLSEMKVEGRGFVIVTWDKRPKEW